MRCVCQCGVPNASLSQSTLVSFTSCMFELRRVHGDFHSTLSWVSAPRQRERERESVYCGLFGHYCMYLNWPLNQP